MFLNVMTPPIMVMGMQPTFAVRDQLMAGRGKRTAFRNAILIVVPARCAAFPAPTTRSEVV